PPGRAPRVIAAVRCDAQRPPRRSPRPRCHQLRRLWTPLGPTNWYIDAVLQGTHFQASANSIRGFANNFSGGGFAASIEGGYPIPLMSWLTFEPQIQGIWQRTSFDDSLGEGFSTITYDRSTVFTGRVGALLRGTFGGPG